VVRRLRAAGHLVTSLFILRNYTSAGGCTLICIYITFTMLPIRLQEAIVGGVLISISHVILLLHLQKMSSWNMVRLLVVICGV
jgi:hypothetical protein